MTQEQAPTRQAVALIVLTEAMDGGWMVDLFAEPSLEEDARHHASWRAAERSKDQVITPADEHLDAWGYRPPARVSHRYVWLPHPWDGQSYQAPIEVAE